MPKSLPSYRQRKGSDQAIVTLMDAVTKERRDYWLGAFGTPGSRESYHRLIARWEAQGRVLPESEDLPGGPKKVTVEELIAPYWKWAESFYAPGEIHCIHMAMKLTRQLFGSAPAESFGPNSLRLVREQMIRGDSAAVPLRKPWVRTFANRQAHRIAAMFKWAAAQELLPASVYHQLKTLEPLKRGRSQARESEPVRHVADGLIDPLEDLVSPQVWAIIQLQRFTGARCGELFKLRAVDLKMDDGDGVWTFSPEEHKTAHHGKKRTIYFGPRAKEIIKPYLTGRPVDRYLFSAGEGEAHHRIKRHARRKTPISCGNRSGTNGVNLPSRMPGDHYTTDSYRRAIARACAQAFPPPDELRRIKIKGKKKKGKCWESKAHWKERLGEDKWAALKRWQREHCWHPHQLRHSAATHIRREFGLEAAQIALGHSSALVTEAVYAERDMEKAIEVMKKIG